MKGKNTKHYGSCTRDDLCSDSDDDAGDCGAACTTSQVHPEHYGNTALIGADLDQIAGFQAQASACKARQFRIKEQKKMK